MKGKKRRQGSNKNHDYVEDCVDCYFKYDREDPSYKYSDNYFIDKLDYEYESPKFIKVKKK